MSNDLPANLYLVCPVHGRFDLTPDDIFHFSTEDAVRSFQGNPALSASLSERRKTPVAQCERFPCSRYFTNVPRSNRYDIEVMISLERDEEDSDED